MKIGDRVFVCGYIDEIRKDTIIIRNAGGYFGTVPSEVITGELPSAQPEPIKINIDDFNKEDLERFKKELGNTPITVLPAQPEIIRCKIIRCKDCKFASGDSRICMKFGHSPIGELDFCAWAERKTDE